MIKEPFGKKCIHCEEEITGVAVVWELVPRNPIIPEFIYMHPECFHESHPHIIALPDIKEDTKWEDIDKIKTKNYQLCKEYSYYQWIGEIQ